MHAPGGYLIWIALGAALTAAADLMYHLSVTAQIITFIIAASLSCFCGYFAYRHVGERDAGNTSLNQRDMLLVGTRGVVSADIAHGEGKVRLGDTVWVAEGPDMAAGTAVIVRSAKRARVQVEPARKAAGVAGG
jgi:membrane protein implicated in regulation of membrane protease activity